MAKPGKSDKTETDQKKGKDVSVDDIEDAEIIENQPPEQSAAPDDSLNRSDDGVADLDEAIEIQEPGEALSDPADEASDEATKTEAATEKPDDESARDEPKRQASTLPMILGGVVAAAIGFGAAQLAGPMLGGGDTEALAEINRRIDANSTRIEQTGNEIEIATSTAKSAADAVGGIDGLRTQVDELKSQLTALDSQVKGFEDRIAALEKRPMTEALSAEAIAAYEREVEALKATVAEQLEAARSLKENSDLTAQEALARAALSRLISAVDSGAPYRAALNDLAVSTGMDMPAALESQADDGVPTLAVLQDSFPDHARAALSEARRTESDADGGSKLGNYLRSQLGARSVEPKDGDDADAVLSRAEAALKSGRVSEALAEIETLPDSARTVMAPWVAQAEMRRAATEAVDMLSDDLNNN